MKTEKETRTTQSALQATQLWEQASGPLTIPMTNDYLFRALLQENNKVLKGLIASLLHIPIQDISSVEITNPIELGKSYEDKDFYLDVKILLNNHTTINLEMQVINEHNWPERSLSYLCRIFDNLAKGATYLNVMPVIQIGLLDFTLFPEYPEFYATYKLLNVKNHTLYSDKFQLSVVDLTHIDIATEEDKLYGIDHWANLFKATTWEELKMLANDNQFIQDASSTVFKLTQEEKVREQCEAREEYYRRQRSFYMGVQMKADERVREAIREATQKLEQEAKREVEREVERKVTEAIREAQEMIANTEHIIAEKVAKQVAEQVAEATASKDAEIARLKEELARR